MRKKSNGLHGIDPYKNKARLTDTSDEPFLFSMSEQHNSILLL